MLTEVQVDCQTVGVGRVVRKGENSLFTKLIRGLILCSARWLLLNLALYMFVCNTHSGSDYIGPIHLELEHPYLGQMTSCSVWGTEGTSIDSALLKFRGGVCKLWDNRSNWRGVIWGVSVCLLGAEDSNALWCLWAKRPSLPSLTQPPPPTAFCVNPHIAPIYSNSCLSR